MKVAFIHDWLTVYGGAERVLQALWELFPDAPIYTTIYNPKTCPQFKKAKIITSALNKIPGAKNHHQILIPFMPWAVEHYDLADYDVIISDSHACAKGAIKHPDAKHICFCHTPMRYVWAPEVDPRASSSWLRRLAAKRLKKWDIATVDRVDRYLANSKYTQNRIDQFYHWPSDVIYPPVDTKRFKIANKVDNYFLYVGRLVTYKKPAIVIEAFNQLKMPLKIVGTGPELDNLQALAKTNIEFLGRLPDEKLAEVYAKCQALIFPTIEDFGIIPVEVMAAGRPVISFAKGGAAETVIEGKTGLIFQEQTPESLIEAVKSFRVENFSSVTIQAWAKNFDTAVFKSKMKALILKP